MDAPQPTDLIIETGGNVRCIYDEALPLNTIGPLMIRRASHVEPTESGKWQADLTPVDGPVLGPFANRSDALRAEVDWLKANWLR